MYFFNIKLLGLKKEKKKRIYKFEGEKRGAIADIEHGTFG